MKFFDIAYKRARKKQHKVYSGENRQEALRKFQQEAPGVMLSIKECSEPFSMKWEKLTGKNQKKVKNKKLKDEEYIVFLDQFATMLDAGMSLNVCLAQCINDTGNSEIKVVFSEILRDIESGQGLTQSARKFPTQLGNLSISMFDLGEQTGTLARSIAQLSEMLSQIYDNRMKFKKATRYPLFVVVAMIVAFSVVITFVVPQFESFFRQSKMELPFPTKLLLWIESSLTNYGPYILAGAIIISGIFGFMYKKSEKWHLLTDRALLKIYIVGKVTYYAMIGRFSYLFQVLSEAGIPLPEALRISQGVVDNLFMKKEIDKISRSIEDGRSLANGFEDSKQFEPMVIQMIQAGEQTGALSKMLEKVNKLYANRYNYIVDNVATLIEPILIAAIAGFVLVLALGIFLPMWSLVDLTG